jgi:hypothetical protein
MNTHAQSQSKKFESFTSETSGTDFHVGPKYFTLHEKVHLFRLSEEILDSFDLEDVDATYDGMRELGIDKDPHDVFSVEVNINFILKFMKKVIPGRKDAERDTSSTRVVFFYSTNEDSGLPGGFAAIADKSSTYFSNLYRSDIMSGSSVEQLKYLTVYVRKFLLVILATKNIDKKTVVNSARSISPRAKKDSFNYSTTTTIKIGKITETYGSSTGIGGHKRPHLRRGHVRNQHFGKGNAEIKQVFIQPVFVNADENWVKEQKTYRVIK